MIDLQAEDMTENVSEKATDNVISPPLQSLLELFSAELSEVKFPNLECATLKAAAQAVLVRRDEMVRAEAAVDAARRQLEQSQDALLTLGQRALSYARVYAEDHAGLAARLEAIALPKGTRRMTQPDAGPVLPRRKRAAKNGEAGVTLFAEAAESASAGAGG